MQTNTADAGSLNSSFLSFCRNGDMSLLTELCERLRADAHAFACMVARAQPLGPHAE